MKIRRGLIASVLCLVLLLTGCSTNWVGEAQDIVAALIPAATNVVALVAALEGKGVSTQDLQTIQNAGTQAGADLQLIQVLITQYENADASAKPGILNRIATAISAVQSNLNGLLPALHIQDSATQAKITAVVGIVLAEVQSLAAIVPLVQSGGAVSAAGVATALGSQRAPLGAKAFVASYNATMSAKTGKAELDRATGGLQIHQHAKVTRVATAGLLK